MRTNRSTVALPLAAALCCFFFGLGRHQVAADPVTNCQLSPCEDAYCWMLNNSIFTAQVSGSTANTTHAIVNIYTPSARHTTTGLTPAGTFDQWMWSTWTADCINAGGGYPTPQTASKGGFGSRISMDSQRNTCSK